MALRLFIGLFILLACNAQTLDVLLSGGSVIDGTGSPARVADVGIRGETIAFIGDARAAGMKAKRTIDVKGLIVAPGYIDPHTHTLEDLSGDGRANEEYLRQGVTTVITGNDGGGPVTTGTTLAKWKRTGLGTNAGVYIGQGAVRAEVMGMSDAAPTPEQMAAMKRLVKNAMEAGALGLSSGLFYAPGSYAKTSEVIELAKIAGAYGGVYDTHMRDESSYTIGVMGAIRESIEIAEAGHIPLHISHIKVQGPALWGKSDEAIRIIREAQARGVVISADQYPYTGSGTSLTASLVPRWAQVGGNGKMLERMAAGSSERARLVTDMEKNLGTRGGPQLLLLTSAKDKALIGQTLEQIAKARRQSPIEAAIAIIQAGGAGVASLNIDEGDIENFMKQDFVTTGSDGSGGHPRKYGTFPRKLRMYVREKHILTLPEFVQRSSAQTARDLRIQNRGRIEKGWYADVIAFDYEKTTDRATYEQPRLMSEGVRYVLVNGQVAIDDGKYTGALAGRPITRSPAPRPQAAQ